VYVQFFELKIYMYFKPSTLRVIIRYETTIQRAGLSTWRCTGSYETLWKLNL